MLPSEQLSPFRDAAATPSLPALPGCKVFPATVADATAPDGTFAAISGVSRGASALESFCLATRAPVFRTTADDAPVSLRDRPSPPSKSLIPEVLSRFCDVSCPCTVPHESNWPAADVADSLWTLPLAVLHLRSFRRGGERQTRSALIEVEPCPQTTFKKGCKGPSLGFFCNPFCEGFPDATHSHGPTARGETERQLSKMVHRPALLYKVGLCSHDTTADVFSEELKVGVQKEGSILPFCITLS